MAWTEDDYERQGLESIKLRLEVSVKETLKELASKCGESCAELVSRLVKEAEHRIRTSK